MPGSNPSKPSPHRRLLSALIVGCAGATLLPARWTRPVVDSVLLPAHAQTSPDPDSCNGQTFAPQVFNSADGLEVRVPECATMVTLTLVGGAGGGGGGGGGSIGVMAMPAVTAPLV